MLDEEAAESLCLLQVQAQKVSRPSDSDEVPDDGVVREQHTDGAAVVLGQADAAPLPKPEQSQHAKVQGPIELLATKRQSSLVVGGVSLGAAPNQVVCLLVALAIPLLFLLAYQFVINPPSPRSGYGPQRSSSGSIPSYNDGRRRSTGDSATSLQSPISSYRVASAGSLGTPGIVLGVPRALVPVAQESRLEVVNLGGDGASVLSAIVSERQGRPGIWLLAASQAPVAWLDTSQALLDGGGLADPTPRRGLASEAGRCVVLHRSQSGSGSWMPSSWGGPPAPPNAPFAMMVLNRNEAGGTLVAQRYTGGMQSGSSLLTVSLTPHGEVISVNDGAGAVLASAQPNSSGFSPSGSLKGAPFCSPRVLLDSQAGNPSHTVIAMASGADVVLVVAAVISAQKLHPHFSF